MIAVLRPPNTKQPEFSGSGFAKDTLHVGGCIMAPLEVEWEVLQ